MAGTGSVSCNFVTSSTSGRGPGRPPGSDGAETRKRILKAARDVFSVTGFDNASLKEIAEAAGLTRNAISNYYRGKLELYDAALSSVHEAAVGRILARTLATEGSPRDRLLLIFDGVVEETESDPTLARFFTVSLNDAIRHPELRERAHAPLEAAREVVLGDLERAHRSGALPPGLDPEGAADLVADLLVGFAQDVGFWSDAARSRRTLAAAHRLVDWILTPGQV